MIKKCFVPNCNNSNRYTKEKLFLYVPEDPERRKKWFIAVNKDFSSSKHLYCCEDHFDLEQDAANWLYYKTIGKKICLKPHIVPHKYLTAQSPIKTSILTDEEKIRKAELLESVSKKQKLNNDTTNNCVELTEPSSSRDFSKYVPISDDDENINNAVIMKTSVGIQTNLKHPFRSKGVNTITKITVDVETSTMHSVGLKETNNLKSHITPIKSLSSSDTASKSFSPSIELDGCDEDDQNISNYDSDENAKKYIPKLYNKQREIYTIEHDSRFFLGIPEHIYGIVHHICAKENIPYEHVLITLKKIRLNDPYKRLAIDFGLSVSTIQRDFIKSIPKIATALQNFIFWPDPADIEKNVPVSFSARYSNVQSIIDCFEVEIEKPSNPVLQASTWSEYKSCNTVKFLLSCTPCGFINFISDAYGGRISDTEIVKQCTYLDELPTNACVLADRGFKHVATLVQNKGSVLVRPPSVSSQVNPTMQEVRDSKIIASLRIHVERVIRRIREFSILKPHSCVHHKLVPLLSYIAIIVCALVNLQEPLTK